MIKQKNGRELDGFPSPGSTIFNRLEPIDTPYGPCDNLGQLAIVKWRHDKQVDALPKRRDFGQILIESMALRPK